MTATVYLFFYFITLYTILSLMLKLVCSNIISNEKNHGMVIKFEKGLVLRTTLAAGKLSNIT